ncbi:hypothetical protein [Lentibacillus saliphilus]|uniref:hypothetical protein n=1 Tax=Lentibacillus saliphilus TaxID=2737028 RepID=UPI001C30BC75|nr:hypothetical protein [Lentibacillus saliphilus]
MKFVKKGSFIFVIMLLLSGCFNIPIGDGNKLKLSKDGVTVTDKEGQEHSVTVDEDNEQVKVKGFGQDGEEASVTIGNNTEIPDAFPSDIPLPDDAEVFQASEIQELVSVGYETKVTPEEIGELYVGYLEGSVSGDFDQVVGQKENDSYRHYAADMKGGSVSIRVINSQKYEGGSNVIVMFTKQKDDTN